MRRWGLECFWITTYTVETLSVVSSERNVWALDHQADGGHGGYRRCACGGALAVTSSIATVRMRGTHLGAASIPLYPPPCRVRLSVTAYSHETAVRCQSRTMPAHNSTPCHPTPRHVMNIL